MVDNVALAQGLVGGILLARAEKAPKAGVRAGLLMGMAGGMGPMGLVLAQASIRSQRRADLARAAAANRDTPGQGGGTKPGTAVVPTTPPGQPDAGQQPATPAQPPLSAGDLKAAVEEPLKGLSEQVRLLGERTQDQVQVLRELKALLAKSPPPADATTKPGK